MVIPSALIHIPLYHSDKNTIGFAGIILVTIQCFIMILSIYSTEKALKKHFNAVDPAPEKGMEKTDQAERRSCLAER